MTFHHVSEDGTLFSLLSYAYVSFMHVSACSDSLQEGIRAPGDGLTGDCEPPDIDTGNWTQSRGRAGSDPNC